MATSYKVLGQAAPSATTDTTVYTVPSATEAVISTIVVTNRGASATFNIAVRPAGAALEDKHYIAWNVPLDPDDSATLSLGITLATTDLISVNFSTADLSVNIFGSEIS